MEKLLAELRRRNIWRAGLLYIGAAWALAQAVSELTPAIGLPVGSARWPANPPQDPRYRAHLAHYGRAPPAEG
ncbi:MAG: hypothetical protein GX761_02860 [Gammaproteobacteria bacterium]|nr:hypothetical protein [Gammaproteobacteria bacterium]